MKKSVLTHSLTQIKHINWLETHLNAYLDQHRAHNKCGVLNFSCVRCLKVK